MRELMKNLSGSTLCGRLLGRRARLPHCSGRPIAVAGQARPTRNKPGAVHETAPSSPIRGLLGNRAVISPSRLNRLVGSGWVQTIDFR
jgi:hypothetical protein